MGKAFKREREMLEYPAAKRWITQALRKTGSEETRRKYLYTLSLFCRNSGFDPEELIKKAKENPKKLKETIEGYCDNLDEKGYSRSVVGNTWKYLSSFFKANELIGILGKCPYDIWRKTEDKLPTSEEIEKLFNCADLRGKATLSLLAFSGLRPITIGKLTLGSLRDFHIKEGEVQWKKTPIQIHISGGKAKMRQEYDTFLCGEGAEYLRLYLQDRIRRGEKLTTDNPLIASKMEEGASIEYSKSISRILSKIFRKAGFNQRPYILRKFFKTRLDDAGVSTEKSEKMMGHIYGIRHVYNIGEVETLRREYEKAEPYLTGKGGSRTLTEETLKEIRRQQLRRDIKELYGLDLEEILKPKIAKLNRDLTIDEELTTLENAVKELWSGRSTKTEQKVIKEEDLEKFLAKGWRFTSVLNNGSGKVIVEK